MNDTAAKERGIEVICYLPLLFWRWLARLLLLAFTAAPLALPVLAIVLLLIDFERVDSFLADLFADEGNRLAQIVAIVVAVGLLANIAKAVSVFAYDQLVSILKAVWAIVACREWFPPLDIDTSRAGTKRTFTEIPEKAAKTSLNAVLSTLAVLLLVGLVVVAFHQMAPKQKTTDRYVVVATDMRATGGGTKEQVKILMASGAVFSLTHTKNAQPSTGEGICLDTPQQAWLQMQRDAILGCMERDEQAGITYDSPPTFVVTAFASVAPVRTQGTANESSSEETNCEIANRRAHAVGSFLAHGEDANYAHRWRCLEVGDDFRSAAQLCAGGESERYEGTVGGWPFNVDVVQWGDHEAMRGSKPADDGSLPDQRRFRVEMLNRAIQIRVPDDFCNGGGDG